MERPSETESTDSGYKAQKRWTVLLVGDLGKIVSFELTKPLLRVTAVCLAAVLALFIYSVVSYKSVRSVNKALNRDVDRLSAALESAQRDREEALVRLMLLEEDVTEKAEKTVTRSEQRTKDAASNAPERKSSSVEPSVTPPEKISRPTATASVPSNPTTEKVVKSVSTARISVRNLEIWQEPDGGAFKFQFMLNNVDREAGKVAGYAFLALKPKEDSGSRLRVFPRSRMEDGKPADLKSGRRFSIARYTFIRGALTNVSSLERFNTATVLVYSRAGDLLVEKRFDVSRILRS
jgi:hypothetical protein